jgi:hypothetical protein
MKKSTLILVAVATSITGLAGWSARAWGAPAGVPGTDPSATERLARSLSGVAAVSKSDVWAVGHQYVSVNFTASLVRHWDGQAWSDVPSPSPGDIETNLLDVAALSATDLWAVGSADQGTDTVVEHWNGSDWSVVASPDVGHDNELQSVAAQAPDDVWAVGHTWPAPDGSSGTLVEHWDGSKWRVVPSPSQGDRSHLYGVTAAGPDDVWAVGSTEATIGAAPTVLVEHWNGSSWQIIDAPAFHGSELEDVTALSANDVWAVGWRFGPKYQSRGLIEHWDGNTWTVSHAAGHHPGYTTFNAVSGTGPDDVWAVGRPIEHWDGSSWSVAKGTPPFAGTSLLDVSALSRKVAWVAGGRPDGHDYVPLTWYWDGSDWTELQ